MHSPLARFMAAAFLVSSSFFPAVAEAKPQVEKKVRAALLMADSDDDKVEVIVEGASTAGMRELLGQYATQDLGLINAVGGNVPAGRLRELLDSDEVVAIYANEKVELVAPPEEQETARVQGPINMPRVQEVLAAEEQQAGVTYGLRLIRAPEAVQFVRQWRKMIKEQFGQDLPEVRVGVVDTGIEGNHPNFEQGGLVYAWQDLSFDFAPEPRDDHGHGSHVAGTIAGGKTPGGIQFGIIPPDMTRLAIARGLNPYGSDIWLISSLAWMADPDGDPSTDDGVHVINNSWGSSRRGNLYQRVIKGLTARGILCVFAAGNSGPGPGTVGSPGHLPDVLTVGAVDHRRQVTSFSSRGDRIVNKAEIWVKPDVCAPGNAILSVGPRNTFQRWPGTSMASPHVAAVAALVRMVNPTLKPKDVKLLLEKTALDLGAPGKDENYGSGLIDALAAVQKAAEMMGQGRAGMFPNDVAGLIAQAKEFMKVRQTQYAVENLQAVLTNFPDVDLATKLEVAYLMGEAYRELGNFKGAVEAYKGLKMLDPESEFVAKGEYYTAWCYTNAKGDKFIPHVRKGIHLFQEFWQNHPEHEWADLAGLEMGKAHLRLQQPDAARKALIATMQRVPNTPHALNIRALLESIQEDAAMLDF